MTPVDDTNDNQRVINEIKILIDDLERQCPKEEAPEASGPAVLEYILKRERIRRGATTFSPRQIALDAETIGKLKNAKLNGPEFVEIEAIFRRLGDDPVEAVKYFLLLAHQKEEQLSLKMSEIGSKARPKSRKPFAGILDEIVRENPQISQNETLHKLKKHEDINVIDTKIINSVTRHEMTVDALREALRRSKKNLQKKLNNNHANAVSLI